MNGKFEFRYYLRTAALKAMQKLAGPTNSAWVRAVEEEASNLDQGRDRWIFGGLLGLATHWASQLLPALLGICLYPLAAIMLFSLLAHAQFLIWNLDNPLVGPIILVTSVAPFAWYLGRHVRSHPLIWASLAFALFQSTPAILWSWAFGEPIGLEWGVNVESLGIPQSSAPLFTFTVWTSAIFAANWTRSSFPAPQG